MSDLHQVKTPAKYKMRLQCRRYSFGDIIPSFTFHSFVKLNERHIDMLRLSLLVLAFTLPLPANGKGIDLNWNVNRSLPKNQEYGGTSNVPGNVSSTTAVYSSTETQQGGTSTWGRLANISDSKTEQIFDDCESWDSWEPPMEAFQAWPYVRSGYDYDGNVVYISEFGKLSLRNLARESDSIKNAFWKFYDQCKLRMEYDAKRHNNGTGVVLIYDFDTFNLANFAAADAFEFSLKLFSTLAESSRSIAYGFLINGQAFLEISKPFLGNALDKFEVFGTLVNQWKPKILRNIPTEQLPPNYGGNNSWKPLSLHVCES